MEARQWLRFPEASIRLALAGGLAIGISLLALEAGGSPPAPRCGIEASWLEEDRLVRYENRRLGLAFSHPDVFVVEHVPVLEQLVEGMEESLREARSAGQQEMVEYYERELEILDSRPQILLADSANLEAKGVDLAARPFDHVEMVMIERLAGGRAKHMKEIFEKSRQQGGFDRKDWGDFTAYVGPGYPGPYGDQAHYVLVPLPEGELLELVAHRYCLAAERFEEKNSYHEVIRIIVSTLEVFEPAPPIPIE